MSIDRFRAFHVTFDKIRKNIQKLEMSYLRSYGLRSVHTSLLLYLDQVKDGMTVTELAKKSSTDKSLISRTANELWENGFIEVKSESGDSKRSKRFVLTTLGKNTLVGMKKTISDYVSRARADISPEDLEIFYKVLFTFEKNIELMAEEESK